MNNRLHHNKKVEEVSLALTLPFNFVLEHIWETLYLGS